MTGKDQRSRGSRRGPRRARSELEAALPAKETSEEVTCKEEKAIEPTTMPGSTELQEPGPLPTIDEERPSLAEDTERTILRALPTPSRSRAALQASRGQAAPADMTARSGARGPEPWSLQGGAAQPGAAGGYRELLQLRGQQAMQRSLRQGPAGSRPPAAPAAALPASPAGTAASPVAVQGCPGPAVPPPLPWPLPSNAGSMASDLQLQQWLGAQMTNSVAQQMSLVLGSCHQLPPSPLASQHSPAAFGQQSPAAFTSCQPPALSSPFGEQQAPLVFGLCQQAPMTPVASQQAPLTPVAAQQTPAAFPDAEEGSAATPVHDAQKLMATLMPDASCLNYEQIAEQLRAALPCSYDD
eukprot:CAMPEP_0168411626 /NCGR_PEP_ID=MMETSP0228-20121227/28296_1 /TAXON_ID=133427 /ORGANISM="Protoceratium reticulatum, Strain CCCM 535 (=CCMP 1889)" /LENGTH=354 /DNA_ID=CAMNT_0008425375 /DNA_START=62 /DNA_END=1126 /DNA_ORIENTATION=+